MDNNTRLSDVEKRKLGIDLIEKWLKEIGEPDTYNKENGEGQKQENNKYYSWGSLPDTLTALEISQYLKISRRRVYELFQIHVDKGGIPNYEIGASKRVDKEDFRIWIDSKKKDKR